MLHNPSSPFEARLALDVIRQVADGAVPPEDLPIYCMDPARVAAGDWRQAGFVSDWLHERFLRLEHACTTLQKVAPLRVGSRAIRGACKKTAVATGRRALWDHKSDLVTSMAAQTDCWIEAKPGKKRLADTYWQQCSRLLLADRLRFNTMRLAAVLTEAPAVGSAFCPAIAKDDTHAKALCVWLNSSLGLLGLYGNRTLKVLAYPRFSMEDMRSLPVPDLTDEQASGLATAFDEHADSEMLPFKSLNDCAVRAALDTAVGDAVGTSIGFDAHAISYVRQALAAEPSISGRRPS